jgi:hypothetical protein
VKCLPIVVAKEATMIPHPTTRHAVAEPRRQDLLTFAAQQRLADAAGAHRGPQPIRS